MIFYHYLRTLNKIVNESTARSINTSSLYICTNTSSLPLVHNGGCDGRNIAFRCHTGRKQTNPASRLSFLLHLCEYSIPVISQTLVMSTCVTHSGRQKRHPRNRFIHPLAIDNALVVLVRKKSLKFFERDSKYCLKIRTNYTKVECLTEVTDTCSTYLTILLFC